MAVGGIAGTSLGYSPTEANPVVTNLTGKSVNDAIDKGDIISPDNATIDDFEGLTGIILGKYREAKTARLLPETNWLNSYRQFLGRYDPSMQFRDSEKSRVFIKITKTKTLAAFGQICEVLFSNDKFPIAISPTPVPEGVAEYIHTSPPGPPDQPHVPGSNTDSGDDPDSEDPSNSTIDPYGYHGDGREFPPGSTHYSLLAGLQTKYQKAGPWQEGPAPEPTKMITLKPAEIEARNMEKLMHDQLDATHADTKLKDAILEMCILGHMVLKGPMTTNKKINAWVLDPDQGKYVLAPYEELFPEIDHVKLWNFYPDPDARTDEECEYAIERHVLSKSELRNLKNRPYFNKDAIAEALSKGPNYERDWWELHLESDSQNHPKKRYEVIEYWGLLDSDLISEAGIDGLEGKLDDLDEIQVNVWICNNEILRVVLNPFVPARIPYQTCPYERNLYSFWGIGVPENMSDSQDMMNGFARLAVDNAALAGNLVFDVNEDLLVPGQDMKLYPGKVFRRQGGAAGQAVFALKFPDTASGNMQIFDRFRQLADESTGIPSYSHGQTGVTSTTRTAAGLSMLMGAAALNIKGVIANLDSFIIQPLGEALFHWNLQFNDDLPEIRGDLDVLARGTSSLIAREVRSQRLLQFLQIALNPAIAPFVKLPKIIQEIAQLMDLDAESIINDVDEAAVYAKIIGQMNAGMQASGGQGSPPGMQDPTGAGGGNIGTGQAPTPGEPGFSGNTGQGANAESASTPSANAPTQ